MSAAAPSAPTTDHPLVDGAGPGWVATETRAPVVALTTGMADFLHRATTPATRAVVVTGPDSRMTQPMWHALRTTGGAWAVRDGDAFYDAATGASLTTAPEALRPPPLGADGPHAAFLRRPLTPRLQLVLTVSTRHRVSRPVSLGGAAELAAHTLTGAAPTGWGATEPLTAAWDRDDLTARSRRRMPSGSMWSVVGATADSPAPALVGTIDVSRTSEGLEETTHLWADVGAPGSDRGASLATEARGILSSFAGNGMPLLALALAHVGAADLTRGPLLQLPPEPLALLVGPPGVRASGLAPAAWADEFGAALVGSPRLPSVIVPLGSLAGGGWARLAALIERLGADRTAELLALSPPIAAQMRASAAPEPGGTDG